MGKNYGYINENDFVSLFNNKYYNELDKKSKIFFKELFDNNIDNEEKIKCWKNRMNQKYDIYVKYKNIIKRISIKSGNSNSMHTEQIQEFKRYLEALRIPYKIIEKYVSYHYGYARDESGNFIISKKLSSKEYKELFQNEIDEFNKSINKTRIIIDMIDRFVVKGRNSDYDIDALIVGTIDDYIWIMKDDLYDLILSKKDSKYTSPHISCMTIGPKRRCIYQDTNYKDRYLVCIRWNFIKERIEDFNKKKLNN